MWKINEQKQYCPLKNKRGTNEMKIYLNYIHFCPAKQHLEFLVSFP